MGKWGKYKKNYKKKWESEPLLKGWLIPNPSADADPEGREACCKVCDLNLRAHHTDLEKHARTKRHKENAEKYNRKTQPTLENMGVKVVDRESKSVDLKLAVYIAVHSAVRSIDHRGEMLRMLGKGSSLENVRIHRTKCSKLIQNVISPAMLTELVEDIGDRPYSLILDESTDVSVIKYLAYCVRYYSKRENKVINDFLGLIEVERATGKILCDATVEYLHKIGLIVQNCIDIGSDDASATTGVHNSFFSHFKEVVPHVQLLKCVCHSLHLCGSKAADILPTDLEFLVRESRNWFARSPLRRLRYKALYAAINDKDMPLNLVQLSKTRWLAWGKAVNVIVSQCIELKHHFDNHIRSIDPSDKCTIGRKLRDLYQDESNLLYLLFLKPILAELNKANAKFQANNTEVTKLFVDLRVMLVDLVRKFIKPAHIRVNAEGNFLTAQAFEALAKTLEDQQAYLPLDVCDFGGSFMVHLGRHQFAPQVVQSVKQRCVYFISVLCKQLVARLPSNIFLWEKLRYLAPEECLKPNNRVAFLKLPLDLADRAMDLDVVKTQWDRLLLVDLKGHFQGKIPNTSQEFWIGLRTFKDSSGQPMFMELTEFALRILVLPFSNAVIERVFSVMNSVKTKARNRLSIPLLLAIMRVRFRFGVTKRCCVQFEPSLRMFELFTSQMYQSVNERRPRAEGEGEDDAEVDGDLEILQEDDDFFEILNILHIDEYAD